jgi:hypothetical protein
MSVIPERTNPPWRPMCVRRKLARSGETDMAPMIPASHSPRTFAR